jgi:tetratricopeptide (TPR) repeat protein
MRPATSPMFQLVAMIAVAWVTSVTAATTVQITRWYQQAQTYERVNNPDQALLLYQRVWNADRRRVDAAVHGAEILVRTERRNEAIQWLHEATTSAPQDSRGWTHYGDIFDRQDKPDQADSVWSVGYSILEDPTALAVGVTDRLIERDALVRARMWAERAASELRKPAPLERRLIDIALLEGDIIRATTHAARFTRMFAVRVDEALAVILDVEPTTGELGDAAALADSMSESNPSDPGIALFAARLAYHIGDRDDAIRLFKHWASLDGSPLSFVNLVAQEMEARGDSEIAAILYEIVANRPSADAFWNHGSARLTALRSAALLYRHMDDNDRAAILFRKLLGANDPRFVDDARIQLAKLELLAHNTAAAREMYTKVVQSTRSRDARNDAEMGLAHVDLVEGKFAKAERRWRTMVARMSGRPGTATAMLRLAEIAMYRGDAVLVTERCDDLLRVDIKAPEANDCLELTSLLGAAGPDTSAWQRYARLRYHLVVGNTDSVLAGVTTLDGTSMEGWAHLLAAHTLMSSNRPQAASDTLTVVIQRFANTPVGEQALWNLAELVREHFEDADRAMSIYEQLLRDYPESVYSGPARRWIRKLQNGDGAT